MLKLGVYIIKYNSSDVLVIERKTVDDYCASVKEGRKKKKTFDKVSY